MKGVAFDRIKWYSCQTYNSIPCE